ncbi:MAG: hypothetical protein LBU83_06860, partial [Bacteroidales bacterium]|nr:hypothetical protein [Bacteroidales bacterium]
MYRKLLLTIILILNCQFSILNCQSWEHFYTYRHFGMKEGLPQSQVFESFQDSYGYLWFSTNDGVCRFDGISFKNYSMKDLHTDTRVLYINQYETAILLISPKNIIFLYPDQTMEYYPLPENYRIHGNHVSIALFENDIFLFNCLLELQQNRLEFTLFRFNLTDKTYTKITENLPELMACISEQKLYAISFFTIKNQKVALYRLDNDMLQKVNAISMEQDDFMLWPNLTRKKDWFATITKKREQQENTHLYKIIFEKDSVRFEYISELPSVNLHPCIERLDENRLLFGFGHSDFFSYMYYFDEQRFLPFPINFNTMMNDILPDHDGNLWFSTESGLFQCTRFLFDSYQLKIASFDNIWGVIKDAHHNVWFSSHTYGFLRADKQGDLHNVHLTYNGQKVSPVYGYMGNCRDSRGRVFLSFHEGIAVYDPEKGKPNQLDHIPTGCSLALYYDTRHNEICFGGITDTGTTLNILHTNGEITTYPFLGVKHIISICRDGNQKLRLGTFTGEAFLDEEKQTIVFDTLPRPYKSVICMTLDDKGILWKGGFNGLFAEDKQGNDHQIFDQTTVFAINYYDKYIVFGSKDKLHILDLQSYHKDNTISIRTFGYYDGFDVMECGQNGASIDDEGFVWVAGGDKVIRFHPEQLMKLPPIVAQKPYLAAIYFADKNSEWTLLPQNSSI